MERYLVYCMDKDYNNEGNAKCGLYRIVEVWDSVEDDRLTNERKAIEKWKRATNCEFLQIKLQEVIDDNPVWTATEIFDEGQTDGEYYVMVQHLPKFIKR